MQISKVNTQIEPKVLVHPDWNSEKEASLLLSKYITNNFTNTMFSLRDMIKNFHIW